MLDGLKALVRSWIPVRKNTVYNTLRELPFKAAYLDVESLHTALRMAESGDVRELFAIYRDALLSDPHIQSEFSKRKLALIGNTFSILPDDKKNADDATASQAVEQMIKRVPGWLRALGHLQDSVLWPVSVVEKVYCADKGGFKLCELCPVPHELLDFRTGALRIRATDEAGNPTNETFYPDERRYMIHRSHLLTTPDHWGGPMRSILFWWLLGVMDRDWWSRFLDRYGSPFLVGKYDQNDDQSRTTLERAFSAAVRIGGLVISKDTSVEIQQASSQSAGEAFEKFYTISRREISKLLVGQTLSAEAQSTGLGSGVAAAHADVRDDYLQFDTKVLGETVRDQLFRQFLTINGIPGEVPQISWGAVSPDEAKSTGELISSLSQAGLRVTDDGLSALSEKLGLPVERTAPAVGPNLPLALSVTPMSRLDRVESAMDGIALSGSAPLAQAFRGTLAPVRQMILDSSSPDDLQKRIVQGYSDWPAGKVAQIIEQALIAFSANGIAR
jgi:phage gp29-like protein